MQVCAASNQLLLAGLMLQQGQHSTLLPLHEGVHEAVLPALRFTRPGLMQAAAAGWQQLGCVVSKTHLLAGCQAGWRKQQQCSM